MRKHCTHCENIVHLLFKKKNQDTCILYTNSVLNTFETVNMALDIDEVVLAKLEDRESCVELRMKLWGVKKCHTWWTIDICRFWGVKGKP